MTIEGSNLGLKEDDVRGKIHIGDTPCSLVEYEVSVKIICKTGPSDSEKVASVIIGNQAGFTESSVHFSYKVFARLFIKFCMINVMCVLLTEVESIALSFQLYLGIVCW